MTIIRDRILLHIPVYMKKVIELVRPPCNGDHDVPHWNLPSNSELSIKTTYDMLSTRNNRELLCGKLFMKYV